MLATTQSGLRSVSVIGTYPDSFVASTVTGIPIMFKANVSSSVMQTPSPTFPLPIYGSVSGTVNVNPSSVLVLNPVSILAVTQSGAWSASLVGTIPGSVVAFQGTSEWTVKSSIAGGIFPISGSVTAIISASTNSSIITIEKSSSIIAINAGSVVAISQGSVITLNQGSSILAVPVGSTIAVLQAPSIVGTYAEDSTHTTADKGIFILGVRNDGVVSFVSANLEYNAFAHDSAGRVLIKPFSSEDGTIISYVGSVVSGSVTLISASAIGQRNYVTDFLIANTGSVAQLVTFQGGDTSLVGFTIAPAGGGSNAIGMAIPLKTNASQDLAFKTTGTSSVVYLTVKGYRAP